MKKLSIIVGLYLSIGIAMAAQESNPSKKQDWLDKTTEVVNDVIDTSKKGAKTGIEKTTNFINKTGEATKKGYKAFKKSFHGDNKVPVGQGKAALPPPYLQVSGFKKCVAIKDMGSWKAYCLPKYRPALCDKQAWQKLQQLLSPKACD